MKPCGTTRDSNSTRSPAGLNTSNAQPARYGTLNETLLFGSSSINMVPRRSRERSRRLTSHDLRVPQIRYHGEGSAKTVPWQASERSSNGPPPNLKKM